MLKSSLDEEQYRQLKEGSNYISTPKKIIIVVPLFQYKNQDSKKSFSVPFPKTKKKKPSGDC